MVDVFIRKDGENNEERPNVDGMACVNFGNLKQYLRKPITSHTIPALSKTIDHCTKICGSVKERCVRLIER